MSSFTVLVLIYLQKCTFARCNKNLCSDSLKHLLLFLFSLQFALTLFAQRTPFTALLISDENATVVQLASVQNLVSRQKALSNRKGILKLNVGKTDSVQISAVGFETMVIYPLEQWPQYKGDTIMILMRSTNYELKGVTIVYSNRKRDSIARAAAEFLKSDPLMNNNDRILKRPRGSGLTGVLTEMYYEFSKAGQDMVKFEQFIMYYEEQKKIDARYNKEVVKRVTNLPDFYMDEFIMFCRPERSFALTANDYDLLKYIQDCGEKFKQKYGLSD
jgi:hypothetical protein